MDLNTVHIGRGNAYDFALIGHIVTSSDLGPEMPSSTDAE